MKNHIFPAVKFTFVCAFIFCIIYTGMVWAIAQCSPNNGEGFTINYQHQKYYENIAQDFTQEGYFWARPSAVKYDASASGGSNYSNSNADYLAALKDRINHILASNPTLKITDIPVDLITASGSGLDPDISVQAAEIQVNRIAKSRNISTKSLQMMIEKCTEKPFFGVLGMEKVNVLKLNIEILELLKMTH